MNKIEPSAKAKQQFGSGVKGFNKLSKAYKKNSSIENYVKLRRAVPDAEIEISVIGGIDHLFPIEHELRRYGFDPDLVAAVMDADSAAISEISLQLMEKIIEARKLSNSGKTQLTRRGLAVPDKLIDRIISCSLDALSWNDELYIPRDLIVLIRERLGGSNPEYVRAAKVHENKRNAAMIGGQLKARGVAPTFKKLGNALGVAPSTVKRWFGTGEFERETDYWSRLFDAKGKLISTNKLRNEPLREKENAQR